MRECSHGKTSVKFFANSPRFWPLGASFRAFAHAAGALMPAAPE